MGIIRQQNIDTVVNINKVLENQETILVMLENYLFEKEKHDEEIDSYFDGLHVNVIEAKLLLNKLSL